MNALAMVGTVMTVLALAAFIGIIFWAYSGRRKKEFDEAAQAPFLLPDDSDEIPNEKPMSKKSNNGDVNHE